MTSWNSQALSVGMSSVYQAAKVSLDGIKKEMSGLQAQINRLQASIDESQKDAALISAVTEDAAESGIYHLSLAPEQGAWDARILSAVGLPPRNAGDFSAVIANVVIAADVGAVSSITDVVSSAISTAIPKPKEFLSLPALPSMPSVTIPDIPVPVPPPANEWKSATMGDIFPSLATEIAETASKAKAKGLQASDGLAAVIEKKDELLTELTAAQKLMDDLENSATFNFIAPPEVTPSNDWYSRLTAPEVDGDAVSTLPVSDAAMFSSATVTVIIAPDYASLVSKFNDFSIKGL